MRPGRPFMPATVTRYRLQVGVHLTLTAGGKVLLRPAGTGVRGRLLVRTRRMRSARSANSHKQPICHISRILTG